MDGKGWSVRRDQAAFGDGSRFDALPTVPDRPAASSSKEREPKTEWIGRTFEIFRKVFNAAPFTLEQEKRFKDILRRAASEEVAFDAIDLMFNEGVRYPTGYDLRTAIDRVHQRGQFVSVESRTWDAIPDCCPGTFDTSGFVHWWKNHAPETSKDEARRAAEGLPIMRRWVTAAEA